MFHLTTHAFFKALLFLGAGSVIVALHHEQDIFRMGGLAKKMPLTFVTMLLGTLALCGIPPFSGFFSKDAIMLSAFAHESYLIWSILFATAGLTAYYMARLMVVVFITPSKKSAHLHTVTKPMQGVLVLLAIGSVFAGAAGFPEVFGGKNLIGVWLGGVKAHNISHFTEYLLMCANVGIALFGMLFAYGRFAKKASEPDLQNRLVKVVSEKFYVDEFYHKSIIAPLKKISIIFSHYIDTLFIDRFIHIITEGYHGLGKKIALMQNGNVRIYALYMVMGISVTFVYISWLL